MLDRKLKNRAFNGVAWSFLDKIINQLSVAILLIYLSNILAPSDFGLIAMLSVFIAISQSIIDSGFTQALIHKSHSANESDFSTVFYTNLILSVFLYLLFYALAPAIANFYNQDDLISVSRILFLSFIFNAFSIVPRAKLTINIDFKRQTIVNTIAVFVSIVVAVVAVKNTWGYWSLVFMTLSKSFVSSLLLIIVCKWLPKKRFSKKSFSQLFGFGSNLLISGLIATFVQNLYTIILGRFFNPYQVGLYHQGHYYTNTLSFTLTSIIQGVTFPILTSIKDEKEKMLNTYQTAIQITALISFPVFMGFAAVSESFVLVFLGDEWKDIVPVLIILSFARALTPISSLNLYVLNVSGRTDLFLRADLVKIPVLVLLLFIALPYGVIGVSICQLVLSVIAYFINAYFPAKLYGFKLTDQMKPMFPVVISSIIMYIVVIQINYNDLFLELLARVFVGIIVYCSCIILFRVPFAVDIVEKIKNKVRCHKYDGS